jgi:O-antigen ligase
LKYFEYFIVYFMMINYVENIDQIKRFLFCLFLTCFITCILGIFQIPGGGRVSAPFEGEIGEPNTFGGYLLFMGTLAAGLCAKTVVPRIKQALFILLVFMIPPFLYTQSRSSYLAAVPALFVLGYFSKRRGLTMGILFAALLASPFLLPTTVKDRILYTFTQREHKGQHVYVGNVRLDTSTSERIKSWQNAVKDWASRPVLGYGITGYAFIDAQFPRVLVETGLLGLAAFLYLLFSVFKITLKHTKDLETPYLKGIAAGFLAGYIGLIVHAMGANTFIIVRIMEPFWFMVGIISVLPELEQKKIAAKAVQEQSPTVSKYEDLKAGSTSEGI